ncbi:50S ribosomal protein L11 methyltransferase [Flavihumibacter stibioxidans]|uniref:Ribosomal protein L11 methyltransferase n=1 Tax=Flavihumibacter stibioxidans TaxID=1834163 RepID=A0ABR7M4C9_9BACT|nr:50S ribosomal protein L11 methyltransferase [Flavihumibacter stibioxidans]MBC6489369.1 ribosomal protein L11 methyltransferase [Flavihumibacter stibioxidans]
MINSYQQVTITVSDNNVRDILIALLSDAGYEGFVEERSVLKAFIPAGQFDITSLEDLLGPFGLAYETETIEQRNWNAEWEAGFQPVIVDDFCAIRADFHQPAVGVMYDINITPKMSFGTGHHATTWLMVQTMRRISFEEKKVLDFGTGTGILAILAEKMGASEILAIDNDSWSIENAAENITRNQCRRIKLLQADTIQVQEQFDIILANINKHVVLSQLHVMLEHCKPGGLIVVSGLLQSDANDLKAAIEAHPLTLVDMQQHNSWLCWKMIVKENG